MYLTGEEYATLAELLGWKEDVTYMEFQRAMLKRDRDMRQYGVARDQRLADATSIRRNVLQQQDQRSEGSFAVTTRQAFRGTGFSNRGRGGRHAGSGRQSQTPRQHRRAAEFSGIKDNTTWQC